MIMMTGEKVVLFVNTRNTNWTNITKHIIKTLIERKKMTLVLVSAIPVIMLLFGAGGWFTTYGIAVLDPQHVVKVVRGWPTISNTGSYPPESCVFSQFFNMSAFLGCYVALLYYKFVERRGLGGKLNRANFIVTISAMFGIMLVGNFQFVNVITVHFVGAFLAFGGIIGVEFMVGVITFKLLYPRWLYCLRFVQG